MSTKSDWYDVAWLPDKGMDKPLHWRKPRRVFVDTIFDTFHEHSRDGYIDKIFAVAALCPQHTFMVLTKRPERMAEWFRTKLNGYLDDDPITRNRSVAVHWAALELTRQQRPNRGRNGECGPERIEDAMGRLEIDGQADNYDGGSRVWPLRNIWLGTSVEDQATADERIEHLLKCPAEVRFLSCEPLLADVCLFSNTSADGRGRDWLKPIRSPFGDRKVLSPGIDWVIVGGESGKNARPCNVEWIRSIVQQCKAAAVPCFVDRLGSNCIDPASLGLALVSPNRYRRWYLDPNGANPLQWPDDLRVFEWPRRNTGDHA